MINLNIKMNAYIRKFKKARNKFDWRCKLSDPVHYTIDNNIIYYTSNTIKLLIIGPTIPLEITNLSDSILPFNNQ